MAFLAGIPAALGSLLGNMTLGGALQAGGALLGGVSSLAASNYQAQVARQNAEIAEQNAQRASQQSQQEAERADLELAALAGQQEAIQGASGLSGRSQVLTRRSTARLGRLDAQRIRIAGTAESRNYMQQAADYRSEASQARRAGYMGFAQGVIGAGASLAGGAQPSSSATAQRLRQNNRIPLPNNTYTTWRPRG